MLTGLSRGRVIAMWFGAAASVVAASLVVGATATASTWTLLFLMTLMPPGIGLIVWRGAPPPTAAEVLSVARQDGR